MILMRIPTLRQLAPVVFSLGVTSVCLFGSSGRLDWPNAWVLLGLNLATSLCSSALISRNPDLQAERSNFKAGKSWDKPIVAVVVLFGPVATWVTAGLETRFRWSDGLPRPAFIAGVAIGVCSAAL